MNKYYTIEKNTYRGQYAVWLNIEILESGCGSFGYKGIFEGTFKQCMEFCKANNIRIKRGK